MPPIETDLLYQKAVLWRADSVDRYGRTTHGDPEEIEVRWLLNRVHESTPDGGTITLDATLIVADDVPVDSLVWLGAIEDWEDTYFGTGSGLDDQNLFVVKTFRKVADTRGVSYRRKCGLQRFRHDVT